MSSVNTQMSFAARSREGDNPKDPPILEKKEVQLSAIFHWNRFWGPGKTVQKFTVTEPAWQYPDTEEAVIHQLRVVANAMTEYLGLSSSPICVNFEIHQPMIGYEMDFRIIEVGRANRMSYRDIWAKPRDTPTASPTLITAEKHLLKYFESSYDEICDNHDGWTMYETIHPLADTVKNYPLAICDPNTVDWNQDIRMRQTLNENGTIRKEEAYLCHNDAQRWYYLKDQKPGEVILREIASSKVLMNPDYQTISAPVAFPKAGDGIQNPEIVVLRWLVWWQA